MRRQLRRAITKNSDEIDRITRKRFIKKLKELEIDYAETDPGQFVSNSDYRLKQIYDAVRLDVYADILKVNGNIKLLRQTI